MEVLPLVFYTPLLQVGGGGRERGEGGLEGSWGMDGRIAHVGFFFLYSPFLPFPAVHHQQPRDFVGPMGGQVECQGKGTTRNAIGQNIHGHQSHLAIHLVGGSDGTQ